MDKNDINFKEKELGKIARGMKERVKNPRNDLVKTKELFFDCIYKAYLIDDNSLNYKIIVASREVKETLEFRLSRTVYNDEIFEITKFEFELTSIMRTFYERAGKHYD